MPSVATSPAPASAPSIRAESCVVRETLVAPTSNRAGIDSPTVMTLGSNGAVKQAAATGLGVTLMSTHAVAAELAAGSLARLQIVGTPLERSWHVLYRAQSDHSPSAEAFLQLLRSPLARRTVRDWFGNSKKFLD
jgi:DNA-binding transcriptional LysR family regulator